MYANQPLLPRWKEVRKAALLLLITYVSPSHIIKVLAKWRDPAGLRGKIIWSFEKQPALQESTFQQFNEPPEEPISELIPARTIQATPKPNVSAEKQQRRKRLPRLLRIS